MPLSQEQIANLEKTPGIDKTLLNTYKKNNPAKTPGESVVDAPEDAAGRINKFGSALNVAIDKARQQRQDSTLDFVGGMVPSGALPASSFAGVLSAFNSDSAPIEASLLDNAMGFARDQEKTKIDAQNSIRELALKVGENGGSQDTVNALAALVEGGDIDTAIKLAASALGTEVQTLGGNLVRIDKKNGTVETLWTAPKSTGGGSGGMSLAEAKAKYQPLIRARWGTDVGEEYANSEDYYTAYQGWLSDGLLAKDFFTAFPPADNVNPKDESVNGEIKRELKQPKAATTESASKGPPPSYGDPGYTEYAATGEY